MNERRANVWHSAARHARPWRALARLVGVCTACLLVAACSGGADGIAELTGRTMGTTYSIKLASLPDEAKRAALQQQVETRLDAINRQMSTYLPDSDLMRFNLTQSTDWIEAPPALVELVEHAARISAATGGTYDITVGPLVNLWGFGAAGSRDTPPTAAEIAERLPLVGYERLQARAAPPALRKSVTGLQADLSSIAKGWAVDQIAELLAANGLDAFLVEIGGEVYARGTKRNGEPWRIAVERPLFDERAVQRVLPLRDVAMATSGDYRNFFPSGGRRYSHTIDPKTGQSVQHRLASVTVLADSCADADGWATALLALGDEAGPALADRLGIRAYFITRTDRGFDEYASTALRASPLWQP